MKKNVLFQTNCSCSGLHTFSMYILISLLILRIIAKRKVSQGESRNKVCGVIKHLFSPKWNLMNSANCCRSCRLHRRLFHIKVDHLDPQTNLTRTLLPNDKPTTVIQITPALSSIARQILSCFHVCVPQKEGIVQRQTLIMTNPTTDKPT